MQARAVVELPRAAHAPQLLREPHQHEPRIGDDRQQHAPERIRLAGGQGPLRRPLRAGLELAEPLQLVRKGHGRLAEDPGRVGGIQQAARQQRLQQGAGDDLAFRIERGDDLGGLASLFDGRRPAVRGCRQGSKRGAQFGQHGHAGRRCRGRRLHGKPLS